MKCIETYDGKEFWIEDTAAEQLSKVLLGFKPPKLVKINNSLVNSSNIAGIYDELDMKEKEYRKQGMWICTYLRWHYFKENCNCRQNYILYKIFETEAAEIKSKQLLEYEKRNGKMELNLDENYYPKVYNSDLYKVIRN